MGWTEYLNIMPKRNMSFQRKTETVYNNTAKRKKNKTHTHIIIIEYIYKIVLCSVNYYDDRKALMLSLVLGHGQIFLE